MKQYAKLHYEPVADPFKLPMPQYAILDCQCIRCGATTRVPVPAEFMDWEQVADIYREAYEAMGRNVHKLFDEAGQVFDAPLQEWLAAKQAHLMMQLEELLEQYQQSSPDSP